ncbi:MAG TPA: hypothetical protein VHK47_23815 [Polyangia bacterium]|nr:hypothetical protein [Polyangia bacterium]
MTPTWTSSNPDVASCGTGAEAAVLTPKKLGSIDVTARFGGRRPRT